MLPSADSSNDECLHDNLLTFLTPIVGYSYNNDGLNKVWHSMLCSCIHIVTVGIKGLNVNVGFLFYICSSLQHSTAIADDMAKSVASTLDLT